MTTVRYQKPFSIGTPIYVEVPPCVTIDEIVKCVPDLPDDFDRVGVVRVGDVTYPPVTWAHTRPKAGSHVTLQVRIRGGGGGSKSGRDVFAVVAAVGVAIASAGIASGALAGILGSTFAAGTVGAYALAAGTSIAGSLLIGALLPPPAVAQRAGDVDRETRGAASIRGNVLEANGPIPRVIGTRRIFPPFAAPPRFTYEGNDEYAEAIFALAGPHEISDIRVDGVPIAEAEGIEFQTREGWKNDLPISLVDKQSFVSAQQIEMSTHVVTANDYDTLEFIEASKLPAYEAVGSGFEPDEIAIQLALPQGISKNASSTTRVRVPFRIRMREVGDTTWKNLPEFHYVDATLSLRRLEVLLKFADEDTNTLGRVPTQIGFVEARITSDTFTADPSFDDGTGDDYVTSSNDGSSAVKNIELGQSSVTITLNTATFPKGDYEIEIIRGGALLDTGYDETTYQYGGSDFDLFGVDDEGNLPETRNGIIDQIFIARTVSTWNEHPVGEPGFALIAVRAKNRAVNRVSCVASGYVADNAGNLLTSNNDLSNADWIKVRTTISTNVATPPGEVSAIADKIVEDTTASSTHFVRQSVNFLEGKNYRFTGKFKADGRKIVRCRFEITEFETPVPFVRANLETGELLVEPEDTTATDMFVQPIGDDWYEIGFTATAVGTGPGSFFVILENDDSIAVYTGDGSSGVMVADLDIQPLNDWSTITTTSNPAPHYREVLAGRLNFDPVPENIIDDASLIRWRERCASAGYTCDYVSEGDRVEDLLRILAGVGYARPYQSEIWGVIEDYDRSHEPPVQMFTSRNSRNFTMRKQFNRLLDGLRANYQKDDGENTQEQIEVRRDKAGGEFFEQINYEGMTNADRVVARARYDLGQILKRSAVYGLEAPAEAVVCRRGSLVAVENDIIERRFASARITAVNVTGPDIVSIEIDALADVKNTTDLLSTTDVLAVTDLLEVGLRTGVSIRHSDGSITTHEISTATGETQTLTFETPIVSAGSQISVGNLVTIGELGTEVRRMLVSDIEPSEDMIFQLALVDEAPELWS